MTMFSWMNPKLSVKQTERYGKGDLPDLVDGKKVYKKTKGAGYGVFANTAIKKGETLFVMGGYILTIEDENELTGIVADKPIEISENFSISPRKPSDIPKMPQHYVNHSCNPNAGFDGQIFMVAMRSIKPGDEIVYDYGMLMHSNTDSNSEYSFKCLCGSKLCRGVVTENDWKRKELQVRYDGFFQHYLQKKITKLLQRRK